MVDWDRTQDIPDRESHMTGSNWEVYDSAATLLFYSF